MAKLKSRNDATIVTNDYIITAPVNICSNWHRTPQNAVFVLLVY